MDTRLNRRVRVAVSAVALTAGLIGAFGSPAGAYTTTVGGTDLNGVSTGQLSASVRAITSNTSCNGTYHQMTFAGTIWLNQSRFPNGAWVSTQYRYYWVNSAGARTTPVYVATPWTSWSFLRDGQNLPSRYMSVTGRLHAIIDVAVWNGSYSEITSGEPGAYANFGNFLQPFTATDCYASWS